MRTDDQRIKHELQAQKEKIKENTEKIKVNKTLPYLVSNVIEVSQQSAFLYEAVLIEFFSSKLISFYSVAY